MSAPESIHRLLDTFDNNIEFYKSGQYNEAQLRQEFLDPFFAELGWDMNNTAGLAPQYRDVIHEASIKAGSATKAPDYAFSIHGQYKFFLEAKKPAVNVRDDTEPPYQLRRYGWSAKLPVSILTDFEEFAIYDCRKRPRSGEPPSTSRLAYFKYTDYPEKWDELCATFSKQAILKGSFDQYAGDAKRHRGIETVDDAFLAEIEKWRSLLARNLALRNPALSVRDLNFAVQKTIDRIIFLRICEDRGAENYKRLAALLDQAGIYPRLLDLFLHADARYNSGLFHFSAERGRGAPDHITPGLVLDDKVLKAIISGLYYPESPYEFSVLPADILGQIYEQFLGKTIRLTAAHQAKIEEKPEVRKAGGVYYTPGYIVDYIVRNTLGRLLDGSDAKKPKPITVAKAADIKVLDPACGSGSFLIVAYQYLLDWYLRRYTVDPKTNELDPGRIQSQAGGKNPRLYQTSRGEWKLTTEERKRILLCHIFGVDIDAQAVEVSKLSLLLKVIEGEAGQADWVRRRQRILPDLGENIQCGNSLIGPEFYHNEQMLLLDEETQYRVNVFDWKKGFPEIMKRGGFDCVIGNPPYIQLSMADYFEESVNIYLHKQFSSTMGRMNTFGFFIECALKKLCSSDGFVSYIVPNTILTQESYQQLRVQILQKTICSLTGYLKSVFSGAVVETTTFVIQNAKARGSHKVLVLTNDSHGNVTERFSFAQKSYLKTHKNAFLTNLPPKIFPIVEKLATAIPILGNSHNVNQAIALKYDRAASIVSTKEDDTCVPILDGRNITRYSTQWNGEYLKYDVSKIHSCKRVDIFEVDEKILFRRVGERLTATLDRDRNYALNTVVVITPKEEMQISLKYVLGLFNSTLLNWFYSKALKSTKKVFSEMQARQIAQLPIRSIDFANPVDVKRHKKMVMLVETMLEVHKKKATENNPETLRLLETRITATDQQIDRLVYELYDLTAEEIALVESERAVIPAKAGIQ